MTKPCSDCNRRAEELNRAVQRANRAERALKDVASKEGDGTLAHVVLARTAWADNAASQRDEWRGLALLALARLDRLGQSTDEIRLAWKRLGDDGLLELVFCSRCARELDVPGWQVVSNEDLQHVDDKMERRWAG